jgi:hypothetical protein
MAYNDPLRDITREMLDKMYESNTKKIILEDFGDRIELPEEQSKEEEKKFRDTVYPRVEFKKLLIYPKASNVEWSGKFPNFELEWVYSLDNSNGIYISGDLVRLDEDMMEVLKKLVGYYDTWSIEWSNKLADEYQPKGDKTEEEGI